MNLHPLVSAAQFAGLAREREVLVVDCRFDLADTGKGERDHRAGHVPGAVYAHLDRDLSGARGPGLGRHPLPEDAAFTATLARWGWRPGLAVVAYDTAGGALAAARLWWLLRLAGARDAAVLDGGLAAWTDAGLPLEAGSPERAPSDVRVELDRASVVWAGELEARLANGGTCLLDARAAPRYLGEVEPLDPVAGHVPGALNRPLADNLAPGGCFKPAAELRAEYEALLAGHDPAEVVHMCGSGVTACHNLLAMEHAGLAGSRIFAPSWSGWVDDPRHPVARGPAA